MTEIVEEPPWGRRQTDRDMAVQIAVMATQVQSIMERLESIESKVNPLEEAMQRSKGALLMMAAIVSAIGMAAGAWVWIIAQLDRLKGGS